RPLAGRDEQRRFGEPVTRTKGRWVEAAGGERAMKRGERRLADRFSAVEGQAPPPQVEAISLRLADAAHAQLVGEVRPAADRRANGRNGAQPPSRPLEECRGRPQPGGEAAEGG